MGIRSGQNVVFVAGAFGAHAAVHQLAFFRHRVILKQEIGVALDVAMQIGQAGGDEHAVGVVPGAVPDSVARIDGRLFRGAVRAQISAPGAAARTHGAGQLLALGVGAGKTAAMHAAGDKEAQRWLRFLVLAQQRGRAQSDGRNGGKKHGVFHGKAPPVGIVSTVIVALPAVVQSRAVEPGVRWRLHRMKRS